MKKIFSLLLFIFCSTSLFSQSNYSTLLKKEVINNDTVVWETTEKYIVVYIEKDHSKLKDCPKTPKNVNIEMDNFKKRQMMESGMDSLASVFIKNLPPNVISKLIESEQNRRPVRLDITAGSDGHILNCLICLNTKREDIMTSEEVYAICRYLQKNFSFKAPEDYDVGCATYSLPITKEWFEKGKVVREPNPQSTLIKKEVVNNDTVVWWIHKDDITAYIEKDHSKLKNCAKINNEETDFRRARYYREILTQGMDSLASVFIENLPPKVISKLLESELKISPVLLDITSDSDGHILNCSISFRTKREDIMTSEEVYVMCRYLQENFSFKAPEKYGVAGCVGYPFSIKKDRFEKKKTEREN